MGLTTSIFWLTRQPFCGIDWLWLHMKESRYEPRSSIDTASAETRHSGVGLAANADDRSRRVSRVVLQKLMSGHHCPVATPGLNTDTEQLSDHGILRENVTSIRTAELTFAQHVHHFVALYRPFCRLK